MTDPNTLAAAPPGEVVPCSECGRGIRLTRRQRLAAHNTSPSNLPGVTRCPGSDRLFSWPSPNTRPTADHPHTDPGDGRTECPACGKWVFDAIHSCKGVPVTAAARARRRPGDSS